MTVVSQPMKQTFLLAASSVFSVVLLFLVIAIGVSVGELSIPLRSVFYAISNKLGLTEVPLSRIYESVIWDFRLSRALVAACCGAGLAICGAVLQSLLKNALAEPYVLGVSAGASTGAVSVVVLGTACTLCSPHRSCAHPAHGFSAYFRLVSQRRAVCCHASARKRIPAFACRLFCDVTDPGANAAGAFSERFDPMVC